MAKASQNHTESDVGEGLKGQNLPSNYIWPAAATHKLWRTLVRLWVQTESERRALTVVGFGGVHRGVVVLGWGSDRCVVFRRAVHRCKILTVILGYGDGPLLPQDICKGPGKTIETGTTVRRFPPRAAFSSPCSWAELKMKWELVCFLQTKWLMIVKTVLCHYG